MELIAGPLTIFIWLASFVVGGVSFFKTRRQNEAWVRTWFRILFGPMIALAFWSLTTEIFWLCNIPLKVDAFRTGLMAEAWWVPGIVVIWTALIYRELRK